MELTTLASDNPIIVAAALITALLVIGRFAKAVFVFFRRITHMVDDYLGVEERPGVPARPGLTQRVQKIEHELHPNSGTSMRDSLDRVEIKIEEIHGIAQQALNNSETTRAAAEKSSKERQAILKAVQADRQKVQLKLGIDLGDVPEAYLVDNDEDVA